jgi:predicted N-formylglutamate amidohydrolase
MSESDHGGSETAVSVINAEGTGAALLLCEHASAYIPGRYGDLGLRPEWRQSHAAWDPGALALARMLSTELDSPLVAGRVSRLVYDINRPPEAEAAMPVRSEVVEIPGNANLTPAQKAERVETVYRPFCEAVDMLLADRPRAIVTVHSFTPVYHGETRSTEIGILHDSDSRLADVMLAQPAEDGRQVDRNKPYGPGDGVTHSLKLHGISRGLPNVMIEVRNDLLTTLEDVQAIATELLAMLRPALAAIPAEVTDA